MALPNEPQVPSAKEQKEILSQLFPKEGEETVEVLPTTPEVSPEIKEVKSVAGAEITLLKPVTDDAGAVMVDTATPAQVTVTLPVTDDDIQKAMVLKIIYSFRWLAEWAKRTLRLLSKRFVYKLSKN